MVPPQGSEQLEHVSAGQLCLLYELEPLRVPLLQVRLASIAVQLCPQERELW